MNRKLVAIARRLRKNQTWHEQRLWQLLRAKRLNHYKFRRQYPIGRRVVDFCCPHKKLIIELDGGGHNGVGEARRDVARDEFLQRAGWTVARFWNNELDENPDGVLERIVELLQK